MLEVIQIPVLQDNYLYLIIDKPTGLTACIDPAVADPVISKLKELNKNLDYILNTHHHYDHVGANLELKEKYNCRIIGNEKDKERIPGINIFVNEGDNFNVGESNSIVMAVSGHTIGHICYHFPEDKLIFCGDTLFSLGCGRLFEGSPDIMVESLLKLRSLPNETKVYCAHEYTLQNALFALSLEPNNEAIKKKIDKIKDLRSKNLPTIPSTLAEEKKLNPFLKFDDKNFLNSIGLNESSSTDNFRVIRQMKDNF
jgi:hydroxyacylglutathione hydrolase|tara:strand:+ start:161 stop:925 length:765 start_codon:yes stop_codon:yes gene_type:complete